MRQASWGELFAPRHEPFLLPAAVPQEPRGWRRFFWWEDLLTLVLLGAMTLTVSASVERAGWVDGMPSLLPIAFFGLVLAFALSRVPWREGFVHLIGLPAGATAVLGQVLSVLPGHYPWDRYDLLQDRMHEWFHIAFTGGISNDELPFIVLVVSLTWLAAYLSSWAVFRWRNVWLALVPGGTLLLVNISYLPGQFSYAFVIFLVCATLLVTRLHLLDRARAWRQSDTPYPSMLSLSVLHATFWLAFILIGAAWLLPQADQTGAMESVWRQATAPMTERFQPLGRLFISVKGEKSNRVHDFSDILPFLGSIDLSDEVVMEVLAERFSEQDSYLRAQVYDIYTSAGWQQQRRSEFALPGNEPLPDSATQAGEREPTSIEVTTRGLTGDTIFTLGQPEQITVPSTVEHTGGLGAVASVEAATSLEEGASYGVTGSVSVATAEELRAASTFYPRWIVRLYTDLPDNYSPRVAQLAVDLTADAPTEYDRVVAIESYLRTLPYDLAVVEAPPSQDAVEYFLFETKRGYFDYHASAMVVMLRTLGIPARLAVGYTLRDDERDPATGRYRVTERSAFAWPEVYFPGYGWIEFNPTPGLPSFVRGGVEPLPTLPPPPPLEPASGLGLDSLGQQFPGSDSSAGQYKPPAPSRDYTPWIAGGLSGALAALLVTAASALVYAWLRGMRSLDASARLWGQTVRLGSWARLPAAAASTPREYARQMRAQIRDTEEVDLLADAYVRHRFGQEHLAEGELERLEQAWRRLRGRLIRRLVRLG